MQIIIKHLIKDAMQSIYCFLSLVARITQGYSKLKEWIDCVNNNQMSHCITVLFSVACIYF